MNATQENHGDGEIRRLLQNELIDRTRLLLSGTAAGGVRLQVPDTDIQIIAGPPAWIASQAADMTTDGCAQREDKSSSGAAPASQAQAAPADKAYLTKLQAHALCLLDAATVYAFAYMQDEAEDEEDCVCGEEQHERAKAVFAAIKSLGKVLDATPAVIDQPTAAEIRARALEEAAQLAEAQNRVGYEWVKDSVWDNIISRVPAAIRALASKEAAPAEVPSTADKASEVRAAEDEQEECWSADEENFSATSLGQLLDENDHLKAGDTVWVGVAQHPEPKQLFNSDWLIENMGEAAYDIAGEHGGEDYPDVTDDQVKELESLVADWIKRTCPPNFWTVKDARPYVLSTDDFSNDATPVKASFAAPSTADSGNTSALGKGADRE